MQALGAAVLAESDGIALCQQLPPTAATAYSDSAALVNFSKTAVHAVRYSKLKHMCMHADMCSSGWLDAGHPGVVVVTAAMWWEQGRREC